MARIRTVKPALFKHEALFDLERETNLPIRLAFIGLFTCCDREGRFAWRPRALKLDVLPYDDDTDFSRVLDALWSRGFVLKYEVHGEVFGVIPTFNKHQVINNKEAKSEIPAPDESSYLTTTCTRGSRVEDASQSPLFNAQGEEEGKRKGREEEGKEESVAQSARREQVAAVFEHWVKVMGHPKAKLDDKRDRLICARMKDGYNVDDLKAAIDGCSKSPFNMGHNEQGTRYDGLDLILRDSAKVDRFIAINSAPPRAMGKQGMIEANNRRAGDEFLNGPDWFGGDTIDAEPNHA